MARTLGISSIFYLCLSVISAEKVPLVAGAAKMDAQPAYNSCDYTITTTSFGDDEPRTVSVDYQSSLEISGMEYEDRQRMLKAGKKKGRTTTADSTTTSTTTGTTATESTTTGTTATESGGESAPSQVDAAAGGGGLQDIGSIQVGSSGSYQKVVSILSALEEKRIYKGDLMWINRGLGMLSSMYSKACEDLARERGRTIAVLEECAVLKAKLESLELSPSQPPTTGRSPRRAPRQLWADRSVTPLPTGRAEVDLTLEPISVVEAIPNAAPRRQPSTTARRAPNGQGTSRAEQRSTSTRAHHGSAPGRRPSPDAPADRADAGAWQTVRGRAQPAAAKAKAKAKARPQTTPVGNASATKDK
ncbi:hypothetical protein FOZ60_015965 [Perkinsus olseni]|uniref:Uncharacterized protein n=1 Tax=Perkinsus olseni TaxID=32597 RepID=A0A7J6N578_PEROL|nr:hypothetical protein FOZ60_015965 [Perkinsus olseni]